MDTQAPKAPRKILVLGSVTHPLCIDRSEWDNPKRLNIADYDVVFVNLATAGGAEPPDVYAFLRLCLGTCGALWLIGNPLTILKSGHTLDRVLPVRFDVVEHSGFGVQTLDSRFSGYIQADGRYDWVLRGTNANQIPKATVAALGRSCNFAVRVAPIAHNKAGITLAQRADLFDFEADASARSGRKSATAPKDYGSIFVLPEPSKGSAADGINLLLARIYGVSNPQREPTWVEPYELPHETPHKVAVERAQNEVARLQVEIGTRQAQRDTERRFRGLLYEQGDVLEVLVRAALQLLGAEVAAPERKGEHDGRMVDSAGHKYVLEIKDQGAQWSDEAR